jgi:hypothetical protein
MDDDSVVLRFDIKAQFSDDQNGTKTKAAVAEAVANAIKEAQAEYDVKADTEVEGSFGGVVEATVILTLIHLLKAGGIAFGKGAVGAAGAAFFTAYVAPKLRALNILPAEAKDITPKTPDSEPKPTEPKPTEVKDTPPPAAEPKETKDQ